GGQGDLGRQPGVHPCPGNVRQHAFHVDHLDQLAAVAGDRGQVAVAGTRVGRRQDVLDRDVDDAFDVADQVTLHRTVELGDHEVARRLAVLAFGVADRQAQVEHRHAAPAHVGHA